MIDDVKKGRFSTGKIVLHAIICNQFNHRRRKVLSPKDRARQQYSAAAERFVERGIRAKDRKSHEPRSGITLQVLLEGLEQWAPAYSPQGIAVTEYICGTLFPLCKITKEEIPGAMEQLAFIRKHCSHMVRIDISRVEQEIQSLSEQSAG